MQMSNQPSTLLVLAVLVATITIAAFVHAFELASRLAQNSDSAQSFVAGKAIADGNVLLSGWRLSIDNFYFTDALPYAAFEWLLGPRPFLMVLLPALTYTLFVFTALLACLDRSQPILRNIDATAGIAFLLASPVFMGKWNPLLFSGFHVATVLGALIALVLCAWISAREDLRFPRLFGAGTALLVVSAATLASDPLSFAFAFGPALAVLAFEAARRSGGPRFALVLLASGTALGFLLPAIIACLGGGFAAVNYVASGVTLSKFGSNLLTLLFGALTSFGANPLAHPGGIGGFVFLVLRGIAFALLLSASAFCVLHMLGKRQPPLLDRLLCAGAMSLIVICSVSTQFGRSYTQLSLWTGGAAMRYVLPAVLLCAIMAGRQIPEMIGGLQSASLRTVTRASLLLFAGLAVFAGDWRQEVTKYPRGWVENGPASEVVRWLEKHHLYQGVGEYSSANLINAISEDKVQIRSVIPFGSRLRPYVWVENRHWHVPTPRFAIWQEPNQTGVSAAGVRATYVVCQIVVVASYHVAVLGTRTRGLPLRCESTN